MVFLQRPISATLIAMTVGIVLIALYSTERNRRHARAARILAQKEGSGT